MKKAFKLLVLVVACVYGLQMLTFDGLCSEKNIQNSSSLDLEVKSNETFYGVFTEEYRIGYTFNAEGDIVLDDDSYSQIKALSGDIDTLTRIIDNKENAEENNVKNMVSSFAEAGTASKRLKEISSKHIDNKYIVSSENDKRALQNLTNFTSYIKPYTVYRSPTSNEGFRVVLKYAWFWEYQPVWTLTDTVAVGWSDLLDAWTDESDRGGFKMQFNYYQKGISEDNGTRSVTKQDLKLRGNDCFTDVHLSSMFQTDFDIKRSFIYDGETFQVVKHYGSMYVIVGLERVSEFDYGLEFAGNYFHQLVKPNASVDFDGKDLSMSSLAALRYDEAIDAYGVISYFEILEKMS